jgi:hypothetical protein
MSAPASSQNEKKAGQTKTSIPSIFEVSSVESRPVDVEHRKNALLVASVPAPTRPCVARTPAAVAFGACELPSLSFPMP